MEALYQTYQEAVKPHPEAVKHYMEAVHCPPALSDFGQNKIIDTGPSLEVQNTNREAETIRNKSEKVMGVYSTGFTGL